MGNFDTPNLHRLSQLGKSYMYKKTTVNLFQTSNISKFYIKKSYRSAGSIEIKTCPTKLMSKSEFKFLSISFLGHSESLIHLVLYWLWKALQGFQKNKKAPCIMSVQYIGGCSVHRGIPWVHQGIPWVHQGDIMSTSGGVQYIRGIPWVHREMFSTSEGYHEYIGGISWVHQGDIMIHVGDTMSISGGCSVHQGDTMSTLGGYHEYIGGISWVHQGMFSTSEFSIEIERILSSCSPTCIMISLHCTEDPPMCSWYPPMYSWYPFDVLNIPRCTHGIPPHSSWYPPDVLMISPRCTEHPLMYRTTPDVLNTHYTGW